MGNIAKNFDVNAYCAFLKQLIDTKVFRWFDRNLIWFFVVAIACLLIFGIGETVLWIRDVRYAGYEEDEEYEEDDEQ